MENEFYNRARLVIAAFIINEGADSVQVDKRQDLIQLLAIELERSKLEGKEFALNCLFPEINDSYYNESPLREAAKKAIFEE